MEAVENKNAKRSPIKTILNIAYYVLLCVIILVAVLYMVMTFSTKDGVTSIFGNVVSSVQSNSMKGTFEKGDIIVINKTNIKDIGVNDIISFHYIEPQTQQKIIVTHRVIEITDNKFVTQGDVARKNNSVDQVEYVSHGDVIGKYNGFKISGLGKAADYLKTSTGFFICILVPVFLFLFWQIYVFTKTVIEAKSLTKQKAINDEARALAEQMLKEMQAQQTTPSEKNADNSSSEVKE